MDIAGVRQAVAVLQKAEQHGNPDFQTMKGAFYMKVLMAIANGDVRMPSHIAREALKVENG